MHVPGKLLYTADTLSRVPIYSVSVEKGIKAFVAAVVSSLPASGGRNTAKSREQMLLVCQEGWPDKDKI